MNDHDGAAGPSPEPRSRLAIYLAAGLAVLVLAGVAIIFTVRGTGTDNNRGIRFEATTKSGTSLLISWFIADEKVGQKAKAGTPVVGHDARGGEPERRGQGGHRRNHPQR